MMFAACFVVVSGIMLFCGGAALGDGDWAAGAWQCVSSLWCMLGAILVVQTSNGKHEKG